LPFTVRKVALALAFDVHDVEAIGAPRDRRDLGSGATERRQRLHEVELAPGELAGQHLQLRRLDRELGVGERGGLAGVGDRRRRAAALGGAVDARLRATHRFDRPRRRLDDHRLLELVLLVVFLDEAQLVMADGDDVAMLEGMLLDQLAVDVGAVGAVQVLEEGIVEDVDDQRVMPADRRVVDADVVVGEAADRVPLLVHVVFGQGVAIQAQNQSSHAPALKSGLESDRRNDP
jgi:hypothetical protein